MKVLRTAVVRVRGDAAASAWDQLAVERPLEIRARIGGREEVLSTTMRTPGEDRALTAGFLFAEGVIDGAAAILSLASIDDDTVLVELPPSAEAALAATRRRFVTSGACGVCGRVDLDGMAAAPAAVGPGTLLWPEVIHRLPATLRRAQALFSHTGGLHAAGLFTADGELRDAYEDVGRHNAVDKLVGTLLLAGQLPVREGVLLVSGRASYELVQKAEAAGIPTLAAVGAPSSAALERATAAGMTLLGFVRDGGFNIYCGAARIAGMPPGT